jgi:signal transduction histidine kinase
VDAASLDRYPPEVEATVYFCCVEALQNVDRHAGAGARATVHARHERNEVVFEVSDDGTGFDPGASTRGAGLTGMSDRLGALGGRLTVSSELGRGTTVSGAIPVSP